MLKLRRCICGGEANLSKTQWLVLKVFTEYNVRCTECGEIISGFTSKAEAIKAWNKWQRELIGSKEGEANSRDCTRA